MLKRNEKIDVLKGIAILLVVFAHFIQFGSGQDFFANKLFFDNVIFKTIYSFHMPLFMIISGYLFGYSVAKNNFWTNIINKVKKNLIPIITWSLIPIIVNLLTYDTINMYIFVKVVGAGILYNLWFLWAVLLCSIIVLLCNKIFNDNKIIYGVLFILSLFIPNFLNSNLYVFMFPYFVFGYLYNKYNKNQNNNSYNIILLLSGVLFVVLLKYYNYDSYIYNTGTYILNDLWHQLSIDLYRYLIGFCGSTFIITLVIRTIKIIPNKVKKLLIMIGEKSFIIYIVTDYLFAYIVPKITYSLNGVNYTLCILGTTVLITVAIIIYKILKKFKITSILLLGDRIK